MKKLTKREKFEMLLNVAEVQANEVLVEFINHELELLAKKNASGQGLRKPTKTQLENEAFLTDIKNHFEEVQAPKTIAELQTEVESLTELTNQKVSALLKKLVDNGTLTKEVIKKKTYFMPVVAE